MPSDKKGVYSEKDAHHEEEARGGIDLSNNVQAK